jgi:hypothetical protein
MGIGRSKGIAVIVAGMIVAAQFGIPAAQALERRSGIWKVLREGDFSGPMNEGAHVRPIKGAIVAKGKHYKFWEYSWLNRKTHHGGNALLVFEQTSSGLSYLGYYEYEGDDFHGPVHPEIRGKTVFFPYKDIEIMGVKRSFEISFENGPPPEAVPGSVNKFNR